MPEPAVVATDFESRRVYQSPQRPSYASWVSFFPGHEGEWYLGLEEVTLPDPPLPQCDPEVWYRMSLPAGYDKSQHLMEAVLLRAGPDLDDWTEVSRQAFRHHHTVGQFGQTRTLDGRFLRFAWSCYHMAANVAPHEILYASADDGATWQRQPGFHHPRFASHPHRLRTLRDGTLVVCIPLASTFGIPERPVRTAMYLEMVSAMQMTLWFSFDDGRSWDGPLPVLQGQRVSETDFVELPSGDLLLINNSIFAVPGRQVVYREGRRFTPGPLERARGRTGSRDPNMVPETVCLADDGILVGCMRAGRYAWSDDEGRSWQPLTGIPDTGPEVYQPWIHRLPDGRLACAGHYGRDAPIRGDARDDQYISLHLFRLQVRRRTRPTELTVERVRVPGQARWSNRYRLRLSCDGRPLPDREVEFWWVDRDAPGYDSWGHVPLEERIEAGGEILRARTDADGVAVIDLSRFDDETNPHSTYQFVARFNADGADADHQPCQTPQFEPYRVCHQDEPL